MTKRAQTKITIKLPEQWGATYKIMLNVLIYTN